MSCFFRSLFWLEDRKISTPPKKRTAPSTLKTDEIPDKLSKIDETSLMTSQDIENVNMNSENTEMKNETDSNTKSCTKSTQTERNSHLQDFDVECDM